MHGVFHWLGIAGNVLYGAHRLCFTICFTCNSFSTNFVPMLGYVAPTSHRIDNPLLPDQIYSRRAATSRLIFIRYGIFFRIIEERSGHIVYKIIAVHVRGFDSSNVQASAHGNGQRNLSPLDIDRIGPDNVCRPTRAGHDVEVCQFRISTD